MEKKRQIFEETLTKSFDNDRYLRFLKELFSDIELIAPNKDLKPYDTFSRVVKDYRHMGNYMGEDKNKVAIFSVCLKNDKNLENARSMQRSFVKNLLENSNCAGALVAFYTNGEQDKWRLSLVRVDYEFSKGKISEKLTPAKRYSYLVGKEEPCHTAKERLYPLFEADEAKPGLDALEDAFSVEAVTKDFFDKYREKYLDLKEFLDGNEQFRAESESRGFDSEQFAKKLMGQIVFLYFIQKKGWLGVNAFPAKLTEREFKNGFYRPGRKPKEILPKVYKLQQDGFYHRDTVALIALSPEEEILLSTLVKGETWGSGPKDFVRRIFNGCNDVGKNFFDDYLEPLFYAGLNKNRGENAFFQPLHRRIPFLNGGLFEELDGYDWENNDFCIANELFSNVDIKGKREADGILDVFDRYNFTMAEDEPMEREVAIDPEMLGKVFENLLDVSDRKSKGAFYTPREIVHYMCQETIINYLSGKTAISDDDIRKFILYGEYFRDEDTKKTLAIDNATGRVLHDDEIYAHKHHMEFDKGKDLEIPASIFSFKDNVNRLKEIDDLLANVKVVDPAVGSGAFPLGMVTEIVKARDTITSYMGIGFNSFQRMSLRSMRNIYHLKREAIKNSIFACDIEPSATDITKLRLWLSLVIDNQIMDKDNEEFGFTTKPRELPNLDCNIICGNSLIDEFGGVRLITESIELNNLPAQSQGSFYDLSLGKMINDLIELQDKLYDEKDHTEKEALKRQIQDIYDKIIMKQLQGNPELVDEYYKAIQLPSKPFVLWQLYFPKVFRENGGFDITIGNPPYISAPSQIADSKLAENRERIIKSERFKTLHSKWDLYIPFMELGIQLLREKGTFSMIVPYPLTNQIYGKKLREYITEIYDMYKIVDLNDVKVFEATVQNCIPIVKKSPSSKTTEVIGLVDGHFVKKYIFTQEQLVQDKKTKNWNLIVRESVTKKFAQYNVLGDYCYISYGLRPNSDEKTAKGEFKKEDLISDIMDDIPRRKYVEAKNIEKYEIKRIRYLEYGTERSPSKLVRPTFPELYEHPKLMFNVLGELKGAFDDSGNYVHNHSLMACVLWKDLNGVKNKSISSSIKKFSSLHREEMEKLSMTVDLRYLLGVMNSAYAAELLRDQRAGDYHIYPEHIRNIPIPNATKEEQDEIIRLVDVALKEKTDEIMRAIDEKVQKLYEKDVE